MSDVPEDVRALLREQVTSFEQLEVLLLLCHHAEREWSAKAIAGQTNIPEEIVWDALSKLQSSHLVELEKRMPESVARYAPISATLRAAVDLLAQAYQEQRAAIMSIMSTNAIERVRSGAIRTFSDAFVIKKKDREDG